MTDGDNLTVYDYRSDVRNVVVTPEIRGRFLRMEPGEVGPFHSHDVGHEVFLVLDGLAEFLIDDRRAVVGPGQMCFARAGQLHEVRVVGDQPMTLFLTVTPHLEPTHTFWDDQGQELQPTYGIWTPAGTADQSLPTDTLEALALRHTAATDALAAAVAAQADVQEAAIVMIAGEEFVGDIMGAKAVVDDLWSHMHEAYVRFQTLMATWNDLALRMGSLIEQERRR